MYPSWRAPKRRPTHPPPRFNSRWRPNYSKKFLKTRLALYLPFIRIGQKRLSLSFSLCATMARRYKLLFFFAGCSRRFCKSSHSGPGAPQSNWNHGNKSIVGACNCSAGDKLDCYLGCSTLRCARVSVLLHGLHAHPHLVYPLMWNMQSKLTPQTCSSFS